MLKANYGDFVPAALLGRQNPAMAGNDVVVSVSQDRDNEVERLQATADLAHLTRRVNAGIVRIGPGTADRDVFYRQAADRFHHVSLLRIGARRAPWQAAL